MEKQDVGVLLQGKNIKLRRQYFKNMCHLIGIQVIYRAPMANKTWDGFGELDGSFMPPLPVGCIFVEHPDQKTLKKMGWAAELQENSSLIQVPYDVPDLQEGALFILPSGLDHARGRVFKVISMENIPVYPVSITCELAPVYESTYDRGQFQHTDNTVNLLSDSPEDNDGTAFLHLREDNEEEDD